MIVHIYIFKVHIIKIFIIDYFIENKNTIPAPYDR